MSSQIFDLLKEYGIHNTSAVSLRDCSIIRPYKLTKAGFGDTDKLCAIIMAVPYLTPALERNISAYAAPRDYHIFFKELFDSVIPKLKSLFPQYNFAGFADDSPISERNAAAVAGLGIIGDNGLLITPEHSSYVFLGEIITDMPMDTEKHEISQCEGCGACQKACPAKKTGICLSELTQKKGELTDEEKKAIVKHQCAWGCDICQEVCPHTKRAIDSKTIYTDIHFFQDNVINMLSTEILDGMSDEEFALRSYSWRKRVTIERNLKILESISTNSTSK